MSLASKSQFAAGQQRPPTNRGRVAAASVTRDNLSDIQSEYSGSQYYPTSRVSVAHSRASSMHSMIRETPYVPPIVPPGHNSSWLMCGLPESTRQMLTCGGFNNSLVPPLTSNRRSVYDSMGNPYLIPPISGYDAIIKSREVNFVTPRSIPRIKYIIPSSRNRINSELSVSREATASFSCRTASSFHPPPPRTNSRNQLIDEFGRVINEDGHLIDENGNLIDSEGRRVDKFGNVIALEVTRAQSAENINPGASDRVKMMQKLLGGDMILDRHGKPPPVAAPYYQSGALYGIEDSPHAQVEAA